MKQPGTDRPKTDQVQKDYPNRKGLKVGVRTEFTVFAHVKPGHEKVLRETIERGAANPDRANAIREVATLHESRFVLFDNDTRLMFASSFDGPWDTYIDDGASNIIGKIFDANWSHCEGYPGMKDPGLKDWFQAHTCEASMFTCNYPEVTVKQIWKALEVQDAFQHVLDDPASEQALQVPAMQPLLDQAAT